MTGDVLMGSNFSTGNKTTDAIAQMNFSGNVIPPVWYHTITGDNGKPQMLAVMILAEIVYWYRPTEVRDEETGAFVGWKSKFESDSLQKSYKNLAEHFNVSKRQVTDAVILLEDLGVIKRDFRTIERNGQRYNNVLYIQLNPDRLRDLTYPHMDGNDVDDSDSAPTLSRKKGIGCHKKKGEPVTKNRETNTKNTTETTNNSSSVCLKGEEDMTDTTDTTKDYRQMFKRQICYVDLLDELKDQAEAIPVLEQLVDVAVWLYGRKSAVFIHGSPMSRNVAVGILAKMDMFQAKKTVQNFLSVNDEIKNVRAYLLATMINTVRTWEVKNQNEYQAKEAAWYEAMA